VKADEQHDRERDLCHHSACLDWGVGRLLDHKAEVESVFFLFGGRRTVGREELAINPPPIAPIAERSTWRLPWIGAALGINVYVIELRGTVFNHESFMAKNLGYIPGTKPCVYVGVTGLTPENHLHQHWQGSKSASFVRAYGIRLMKELYEHYNPMPWELAREIETVLAEHLRGQGYGVWQN
jgi:hypothetical protein